MNPLGLDASRFLVASDAQGNLTACGQLEPKPSPAKLEFQELRTLIVARNFRSASAGQSDFAFQAPSADNFCKPLQWLHGGHGEEWTSMQVWLRV